MVKGKGVLIYFSEDALRELDELAKRTDRTRSKTIRAACEQYILNEKRKELEKSMREGYKAMAEINLEWAQSSLVADNEVFLKNL